MVAPGVGRFTNPSGSDTTYTAYVVCTTPAGSSASAAAQTHSAPSVKQVLTKLR